MARLIQDSLNELAETTGLRNQDALNIINNTTGLSQQDALNALAGTSGLSRQDAANVWAGTSGLSLQDALDTKATNGLGGFVPSDIPGLVAWFKADGTLYQDSGRTTLATANDDPVGSWSDASGNDRHLSQTTAGKRPLLKTNTLNSLPVVSLDGVDDYMQTAAFTYNQPETVYMVLRMTWVQDKSLFDGIGINGMRVYMNGTSPFMPMYAGANGPTTNDLPENTWGIATFIFNGASSISQINNITEDTGNVSTNNAGGFTLGSLAVLFNNNGDIDVGEVCLFNTAHDATQRTNMKDYLSAKWGITI